MHSPCRANRGDVNAPKSLHQRRARQLPIDSTPGRRVTVTASQRPKWPRIWGPDDREIFSLAIPVLGSLCAGQLYVLVDTAIVGHLGQGPLAGLGLAGTVISAALAMCNFLAYATTAYVGRTHAAGDLTAARDVANHALWLSSGLGLIFVVLGSMFGRPLLDLLSGGSEVAGIAHLYLGIAVFGVPFSLIAIAAQGYLRGVKDLKTPLIYLAGGNTLNVMLEIAFVYGFEWGLPGSAAATVLAQAAMGAGFIAKLVREAGGLRPPAWGAMRPLLRASSQLFVRTSALYGSFVVVGSTLAHIGAASLAAHQVLFQLWIFLALVLDAVAIAGQVLVSRKLGAGEGAAAVASARRMIGWSGASGAVFAAVLLALGGLLPRIFTGDAAVLERVAAAWPIFALMQPFNGAVFALDGILIGAGDSRYLMWSMLASAGVTVPLVLLSYAGGWGITGVWLAVGALILVRLLTIGLRFRSGRWVNAVAVPTRSA
ncbi:MAG: MATE family efflux transporter [Dehalococcoidia bacterium]|nr:MATE family efflux transporter [Dehalococcoidia bacterium]